MAAAISPMTGKATTQRQRAQRIVLDLLDCDAPPGQRVANNRENGKAAEMARRIPEVEGEANEVRPKIDIDRQLAEAVQHCKDPMFVRPRKCEHHIVDPSSAHQGLDVSERPQHGNANDIRDRPAPRRRGQQSIRIRGAFFCIRWRNRVMCSALPAITTFRVKIPCRESRKTTFGQCKPHNKRRSKRTEAEGEDPDARQRGRHLD